MVPEIRKTSRSIILQKCTKYHDHMLYCFTDLVHESCNFIFHFGFWTIFDPFALLTAQKIKIKKKNEKSTWRYYFTHVYQKL